MPLWCHDVQFVFLQCLCDATMCSSCSFNAFVMPRCAVRVSSMPLWCRVLLWTMSDWLIMQYTEVVGPNLWNALENVCALFNHSQNSAERAGPVDLEVVSRVPTGPEKSWILIFQNSGPEKSRNWTVMLKKSWKDAEFGEFLPEKPSWWISNFLKVISLKLH